MSSVSTIRDLRYNFPEIEENLRAGQEIELTKHGRVIARLLPPRDAADAPKPKQKPDYLARLTQIYGDKVLAVSGAELLAADRERF